MLFSSVHIRMEYKILHIFDQAIGVEREMTPVKMKQVKQYWQDSIEEVKNKKGFAAYLTGPPSRLSKDKCQILLYLPRDQDKEYLDVFKTTCLKNRFLVSQESLKDHIVTGHWLAFYIKQDKGYLTVY